MAISACAEALSTTKLVNDEQSGPALKSVPPCLAETAHLPRPRHVDFGGWRLGNAEARVRTRKAFGPVIHRDRLTAANTGLQGKLSK